MLLMLIMRLGPLVAEIRAWLDGSHSGLGLPEAVEKSFCSIGARERTSEKLNDQYKKL